MVSYCVESILFFIIMGLSTMAQKSYGVTVCGNNEDCPNDKVCNTGSCKDPCKMNACGRDTLCQVSHHMAICSCKPGYSGTPLTGCYLAGVPDCEVNEDCPIEKICKSKTCTDPCLDNVCGQDSLCVVNDHVVICSCKSGFRGNPFIGCQIEDESNNCDSNAICTSEKIYMNGSCIDPCTTANCGENTQCRTHNHMVMCSCKPGYTSSATNGCELSSEPTGRKKQYAIFKEEMNWHQSLAHCNALNMKLATINNQEEQTLLHNMIRELNYDWWWIGSSDLGVTGNFIWITTGKPLTFRYWWPGKPNNYKHADGEVHHCVAISGPHGQWADGRCSAKYYHICEQYV